ncbi:MAG: hypothetical protein IJ588_02335 [Prevotella sp.]|nr:hypothetical protein [Prevotella sp.]
MQETTDSKLLHQIDAGTKGRRKGHSYENELARRANRLAMPYMSVDKRNNVVHNGAPEIILLDKILAYLNWDHCDRLEAYATGKLATSEKGSKEITIDGQSITSAKSDVILVLYKSNEKRVIGVSVKQCNNRNPTNAQVFFSTATAFYHLLTANGISLSTKALKAMRQFCGDMGFRPMDDIDCSNRLSSPERYFWEEIDREGKSEWESVFINNQDKVTRLLLQKAYSNDPFPPEIILHKTKKAASVEEQEIAIFTMDQFIELSRRYSLFAYSMYRVKKGRFKEPEGVLHQAPRFGVVQMQRGGQKQHPTQLQFNLKAGYFYELDKL